jgi:hypothetical protein
MPRVLSFVRAIVTNPAIILLLMGVPFNLPLPPCWVDRLSFPAGRRFTFIVISGFATTSDPLDRSFAATFQGSGIRPPAGVSEMLECQSDGQAQSFLADNVELTNQRSCEI